MSTTVTSRHRAAVYQLLRGRVINLPSFDEVQASDRSRRSEREAKSFTTLVSRLPYSTWYGCPVNTKCKPVSTCQRAVSKVLFIECTVWFMTKVKPWLNVVLGGTGNLSNSHLHGLPKADILPLLPKLTSSFDKSCSHDNLGSDQQPAASLSPCSVAAASLSPCSVGAALLDGRRNGTRCPSWLGLILAAPSGGFARTTASRRGPVHWAESPEFAD